jgi:hypothetical protein
MYFVFYHVFQSKHRVQHKDREQHTSTQDNFEDSKGVITMFLEITDKRSFLCVFIRLLLAITALYCRSIF